jgi:RNA polymerase primary sigma factor
MQASCHQPPLTQTTVLELARRIQRWQQHPDGPDHAPKPIRRSALKARDRLVSHNLRLVPHIWRRHRHSLPASDEATADAFQEAALHLMRAAEKFDPAKGYSFSTYAAHWVRCGFGEVERRGKRTIRFPYDKAKVVLRAVRLHEQHQAATGQQLSLVQLAQRLVVDGKAITAAQLADLLRQWALTCTDSLDEAAASGRADDVAPANSTDSDSAAALLPQLLEQLEPQERRMIHNRYLRRPPLTPHQLRRAMAMEPSAMEQLEAQALAKLRRAAAAWRSAD